MQTAIQLTDQQLTHLLVRIAKQLATASSAIYKTVRHYVSKCFFFFSISSTALEAQTVAFSSKCRRQTKSKSFAGAPQHCRRNYFIATYLHIIYNNYKNYNRTRSLSLRVTPLYAQPKEILSCPRLTLRYIRCQVRSQTVQHSKL